MPKKSPGPSIVTITPEKLEELLGQLRGPLPVETYGLVEGLLRTLQWIMAVLAEKKASLRRLRDLLFRSTSEKADKLFPEDKQDTPASGQKAKR